MALGKNKINPITGKFDVRVTEKDIKELMGFVETIDADNLSLEPGTYKFAEGLTAPLNIDFLATAKVGSRWVFHDPHWTNFSSAHLIGKATDSFLSEQGGSYDVGKFAMDFNGVIVTVIKDSDTQYTVDTGFIPDTEQAQEITTLDADNLLLEPGEYKFANGLTAPLNIDFLSTADVSSKWVFYDPHWTNEASRHLLGKATNTFLSQQGGTYQTGQFEFDFNGAIVTVIKDSDTQYTVDTGYIPDVDNNEEVTTLGADNLALSPGYYKFENGLATTLNIDFLATAKIGSKWVIHDPHWTNKSNLHLIGKATYSFLSQQGGAYEVGQFEMDFNGAIVTFIKESNTQFAVDTGYIPDAGDSVEIATDDDITARTAGKVLDASHIIDEDDFASDSDVKVPTQQSVHSYVDRRDNYLSSLGTVRKGMTLRFNAGTGRTARMDEGTFLEWDSVTHQPDPHAIAAEDPFTFGYLLSDGTVPALNTGIVPDASNTTIITNLQYEPNGAGAIADVTAGREIAHRVYKNPLTGDSKVLLAQHQWNTAAELLQKIQTEDVVVPTALASYEYIGAILVSESSTNYQEGNNSGILMASEFGSVTGSGGSGSAEGNPYIPVASDNERNALTNELTAGVVVGVLSSAENNNGYAEYRVINPDATWALTTKELIYPPKEITEAQAISTTGADYTFFGAWSAERADQWGQSRRVQRIFDVDSGAFDYTALNYADRTAIYVRNADDSNGLNYTYRSDNTVALQLRKADGTPQSDINGVNTFNVQPGEIVFAEKDENVFRGSIIPAERVKNFVNAASANAFGALPHDSIVTTRDGLIGWRKTGVNTELFPSDGKTNDHWFIIGGSDVVFPGDNGAITVGKKNFYYSDEAVPNIDNTIVGAKGLEFVIARASYPSGSDAATQLDGSVIETLYTRDTDEWVATEGGNTEGGGIGGTQLTGTTGAGSTAISYVEDVAFGWVAEVQLNNGNWVKTDYGNESTDNYFSAFHTPSTGFTFLSQGANINSRPYRITVYRDIERAGYVLESEVVLVEDKDVVLIDQDATNNNFYSFSSGETWADVKANYAYIRFDVMTSDSGVNRIAPITSFWTPAQIDQIKALPGSLIANYNGVIVNISTPVDTDTGFTYLQSSGDIAENGRMNFRVVGVKANKTVVRPEDLTITNPMGTGQLIGNGDNTATFNNAVNNGGTLYNQANSGGIGTTVGTLADIGVTLQAGDEIMLQTDIGLAFAIWTGNAVTTSTRFEQGGGSAQNTIRFSQTGTVLEFQGNNANGTRQWLKIVR